MGPIRSVIRAFGTFRGARPSKHVPFRDRGLAIPCGRRGKCRGNTTDVKSVACANCAASSLFRTCHRVCALPQRKVSCDACVRYLRTLCRRYSQSVGSSQEGATPYSSPYSTSYTGKGAVLDGWTDPIGAHDKKVIELEEAMFLEKELVREVLSIALEKKHIHHQSASTRAFLDISLECLCMLLSCTKFDGLSLRSSSA